MSDEPATFPIDFKCLKCGSANIIVSNGYADDSMVSCGDCGQKFGLWPEVKAKAVEVAKKSTLDHIKKGLGPGWKFK